MGNISDPNPQVGASSIFGGQPISQSATEKGQLNSKSVVVGSKAQAEEKANNHFQTLCPIRGSKNFFQRWLAANPEIKKEYDAYVEKEMARLEKPAAILQEKQVSKSEPASMGEHKVVPLKEDLPVEHVAAPLLGTQRVKIDDHLLQAAKSALKSRKEPDASKPAGDSPTVVEKDNGIWDISEEDVEEALKELEKQEKPMVKGKDVDEKMTALFDLLDKDEQEEANLSEIKQVVQEFSELLKQKEELTKSSDQEKLRDIEKKLSDTENRFQGLLGKQQYTAPIQNALKDLSERSEWTSASSDIQFVHGNLGALLEEVHPQHASVKSTKLEEGELADIRKQALTEEAIQHKPKKTRKRLAEQQNVQQMQEVAEQAASDAKILHAKEQLQKAFDIIKAGKRRVAVKDDEIISKKKSLIPWKRYTVNAKAVRAMAAHIQTIKDSGGDYQEFLDNLDQVIRDRPRLKKMYKELKDQLFP